MAEKTETEEEEEQQQIGSLQSFTSHSLPHISALLTASSLLTNPTAPAITVHSTVDSLLRSLPRHSADPTALTLSLSLLTRAASLHPSTTQSVVSSLRSLVRGPDRVAAAAVSALVTICEGSVSGDGGMGVLESVLDENLVLVLASSGVYRVRSRVLRLLVYVVGRWRFAGGNWLPDGVLVRVLLGFSGDLYPVLRRDAVDGLFEFLAVAGASVDIGLVARCLECALGLMRGDDDELVRLSAVRMVGLCGKLLAEKEKGVDNSERIDTTFTQVCCMARDGSVRVRIETFKALGKLKLVSDNVLMQSLSKKSLGAKGEAKSLVKLDKESKPSFSCAAGAYIHGIEDEFYEVRTAACSSLGIHAVLSIKFADNAINLLMDLMNDDAEVVLLEALDSLCQMAAHECLNVHEKHMHMFLGLLTDMSALVRHGARKTLQLIKLPKLDMFKSTVNGLIANLEKYPEEEEEIFFALFSLGKNHHRFSLSLAKDLAKQIEQTSKVGLALDKPSMAAVLVVCIASPLSENETESNTPVVLFSYAVPLLGKISRALQDIIDQDFLLTFLLDRTNKKWKAEDLMPKTDSKGMNEALLQSFIKFISKSIRDAWSLIKRSNVDGAKVILRSCAKELEMISLDAAQSVRTTLNFLSQYIQILQLISDIRCKFDLKSSATFHIKIHHILLDSLDRSVRRILYCFTGWTREIECHILELSLLSDVLTLSLDGIHSYNYRRNLSAKIVHLEAISCLSDFTKEVKRLIDGSFGIIDLHGLLELLEIPNMEFPREMKFIKAELKVAGNDSEKPLTFVPGLPVGIRFSITLHNTSSARRLWLCMSAGGGLAQYVFLDMCNFEESKETMKYTSVIPFYETPRVASFEIRVRVVIECLSEYHEIVKEREVGPKYQVTELSGDSIVYFSSVKNR